MIGGDVSGKEFVRDSFHSINLLTVSAYKSSWLTSTRGTENKAECIVANNSLKLWFL